MEKNAVLKPIRRSGRKSIQKVLRPDEVDQLPDIELALWLEEHTDWGGEFDPETQAQLMRRIWTAERTNNQRWTVTCKRRRPVNGMSRVERIHIDTVGRFPSRYILEEMLMGEGWGGGAYYVSPTRGKKFTHRIELLGDPDDPYAAPPPPVKKEFKDELKSKLEDIAFQYLKQNPEQFVIVALRYLEKELGIKIPMPPKPDPNAPVPYAELSAEDQEYLDENQEAKDFYFRRQLGLEIPEVEDSIEEKLAKALEEQIIDDVRNGIGKKSSGAGQVFAAMLEGTNLTELLGQIAKTWPDPFIRLAGLVGTGDHTESSPPQETESVDPNAGTEDENRESFNPVI